MLLTIVQYLVDSSRDEDSQESQDSNEFTRFLEQQRRREEAVEEGSQAAKKAATYGGDKPTKKTATPRKRKRKQQQAWVKTPLGAMSRGGKLLSSTRTTRSGIYIYLHLSEETIEIHIAIVHVILQSCRTWWTRTRCCCQRDTRVIANAVTTRFSCKAASSQHLHCPRYVTVSGQGCSHMVAIVHFIFQSF